MQMRKILWSPSLAYDSAHVKYSFVRQVRVERDCFKFREFQAERNRGA